MPTLLGTSGAVYVAGRLSDQPKVSHLGMDLIEALAVSGALTQTLKHTLALVDVKVLDHFIVGGTACMSFAERGLI